MGKRVSANAEAVPINMKTVNNLNFIDNFTPHYGLQQVGQSVTEEFSIPLNHRFSLRWPLTTTARLYWAIRIFNSSLAFVTAKHAS